MRTIGVWPHVNNIRGARDIALVGTGAAAASGTISSCQHVLATLSGTLHPMASAQPLDGAGCSRLTHRTMTHFKLAKIRAQPNNLFTHNDEQSTSKQSTFSHVSSSLNCAACSKQKDTGYLAIDPKLAASISSNVAAEMVVG